MSSWLDNFFAALRVRSTGTLQTQRGSVNFKGAGVVVADNPGADSTDVTIAGGGGGAGLSSATPQGIGTAAAGAGTLASRDDHVHAHGAQTDPAMHALATISANGFMSAADKVALAAAVSGTAAWETIVDLDFTALVAANVKTAGDGRQTFGAYSLLIAGVANTSAWNIVPGTGMVWTNSSASLALVAQSIVVDSTTDPRLGYLPAGEEWEWTMGLSMASAASASEGVTMRVTDGTSTSRLYYQCVYNGSSVDHKPGYNLPVAGTQTQLTLSSNVADKLFQIRATDHYTQMYSGASYAANWGRSLRSRLHGENTRNDQQWIASGNGHILQAYFLTGTPSGSVGRVITLTYLRIRRRSVNA